MAGGPSCPGFQCSVIWSVRSFFRVRSAVMLTARGGGSPAFDVSFTGFAARGQAGGAFRAQSRGLRWNDRSSPSLHEAAGGLTRRAKWDYSPPA